MPESLSSGAFTTIQIGWLDASIILVYLVGIVGIGCWAGMRRRDHEGDAYFLGGKSLTWPVIGAALFASNISTVHMVSLAECGYKSGLLYGNFEWMAPFTLICLALWFAPFYVRSGVATLPDFLEKRYNRFCRDWLAILSIVMAVVVHIGVAFYTGALVLNGMFGVNIYVCIVVAAGLAGLYTVVGGLLAVMVTETIQTVILLIGAISITLIGLFHSQWGIGGWSELQANVHPVNLSIIRPSSDPTGLSMWAVFLGYPIIGLWYWCCDQVIVQRVLAAKDENHARVGPLFTGFIKILPMFIFVLPGLICLGMINKGVTTDPMGDPKNTLTYLITHVLPPGMVGIMAAALLAAMMGSVSAALNSIATVFSYDVVKRYKPDIPEHKLVQVGRIATGASVLVAIVLSPLFGKFEMIFQGIQDIICYTAPPITAVFLLGIFWRGASARAAVITMLSGFVMGVGFFFCQLWFPKIIWLVNAIAGTQFVEREWTLHSMISGVYLFAINSIVLIVFSHVYPQPRTPELESMVWKSFWEPLRGKAWRGIGNFRVLAATLALVMGFLYWGFAGAEHYYPIQIAVKTADGEPVAGVTAKLECLTDAKHSRTDTSDKKGQCGYGTKKLAGGAPEGYRYRLTLANGSGPLTHSPCEFPVKAASNDIEVTINGQTATVSGP